MPYVATHRRGDTTHTSRLAPAGDLMPAVDLPPHPETQQRRGHDTPEKGAVRSDQATCAGGMQIQLVRQSTITTVSAVRGSRRSVRRPDSAVLQPCRAGGRTWIPGSQPVYRHYASPTWPSKAHSTMLNAEHAWTLGNCPRR